MTVASRRSVRISLGYLNAPRASGRRLMQDLEAGDACDGRSRSARLAADLHDQGATDHNEQLQNVSTLPRFGGINADEFW